MFLEVHQLNPSNPLFRFHLEFTPRQKVGETRFQAKLGTYFYMNFIQLTDFVRITKSHQMTVKSKNHPFLCCKFL